MRTVFFVRFEKSRDGNERCAICGTRGELICCDGTCKRSFHLQCLNILPDELPEEVDVHGLRE